MIRMKSLLNGGGKRFPSQRGLKSLRNAKKDGMRNLRSPQKIRALLALYAELAPRNEVYTLLIRHLKINQG